MNPTPSQLTNALINMGYNAELSAPLIANVYLQHVHMGITVPSNWEDSTIKDVQTCYNKLVIA